MNSFRNRLLVAVLVFFALPQVHADSLEEVYQLALQNDPALKEAYASLQAALETKPQARSALLPQLNFFGNYTDDDSTSNSTFLQVNPATGETTIVPNTQEAESRGLIWNVQLQQSIFNYDQWVQLKQASKTVAQAQADYKAAEQDLIVRVAQRYFDVLGARDTLEATEAAKEAIARQLEQSEKRFEVGLIAITDVQESQAAYDRSVAAVIAAHRVLAIAREFLREITGVYFAGLQTPSEEMPLLSPDPANEEDWVTTANDQNLALISSRLGAEIAREEIKVRRSGHFPTLDLILTHREQDFDVDQVNTREDPTMGPITSAGPADFDTENDTISLQFNVPIYSGGNTSSQVREANYQYQAAKQQLIRVARQTERETRDAYLSVISDISQVHSLKQALASSETALRATEAGYEVGTRTTVDVLDGRRSLFQAQTDYAISRYAYIVNVMRLKNAAGILQNQDVSDVNRWLQ